MKRQHVLVILAAAIVLLGALVTMTDPTKLSALLLILPFVLLFIALWCGGFLLLRQLSISRFRSMRLSVIIAGLPVGLLLLQSIGQLTFRDFITILTFFGIAYFYIARITASPAE